MHNNSNRETSYNMLIYIERFFYDTNLGNNTIPLAVQMRQSVGLKATDITNSLFTAKNSDREQFSA